MITIPEYIFRDGSIKFKCPALEMSHKDAVQMHNVLTDARWPEVLGKEEYICHAMKELGFDSTLISDTLSMNYDHIALDGCLCIDTKGSWPTRINVANIIRKVWCEHMANELKRELGLTL